MEQPNGLPPASAFREKLRAKVLLGRIERYADLAQTIEQLEQRERSESPASPVVDARICRLRVLYQRAIGLPLEQRDELAAALKPIMQTGDERVADVLERLREANGTDTPCGIT